jgi:hypothetical protein
MRDSLYQYEKLLYEVQRFYELMARLILCQGVPHAVQKAERWHLLKNLSAPLERLLARRNHDLREAARQLAGDASVVQSVPPDVAPPVKTSDQHSCQQREGRLASYERVTQLRQRGIGLAPSPGP